MARRYHVKITSSGYIYILITAVISIAAVNTGNNLLYLISSILLALMFLSGISSLRNLLLDITFIPSRVIFAEAPSQFQMLIHKKRGASFFLSFETPFGSARIPYSRGKAETSIWLKLPKRGRTRIKTLEVHSGFPLGFFRRFRIYPVDLEVMVYPKPIPRKFPPLDGDSQGAAKSNDLLGDFSDEIKELRRYRDSDPLKWVDWKATARKGKMVVREFYRLEGNRLIIDLSKREGDWERSLSEACYVVLEAHRKELPVSLILPNRKIGPGSGEKHKRLLLEALSLA